MGIFNDGMYTEEEVEKIKDIFFEAGCLFCEFINTPAAERERLVSYLQKGFFLENRIWMDLQNFK